MGLKNTELHLEILSAQVICCKYLLTLKSNISIGENSVGPDQTAPTLHVYSLLLSGHYVLMEATGQQANAKARLISPSYTSSRTMCLRFWYNMNGQDVKTLNVYTKTRSLGNVRWTITGNQGAQWNVGQVTVRGVRQPYSVSTHT